MARVPAIPLTTPRCRFSSSYKDYTAPRKERLSLALTVNASKRIITIEAMVRVCAGQLSSMEQRRPPDRKGKYNEASSISPFFSSGRGALCDSTTHVGRRSHAQGRAGDHWTLPRRRPKFREFPCGWATAQIFGLRGQQRHIQPH